jgi:hypothetical protein
MKKGFLIKILYIALFLAGFSALTHGFPDIERFFGEWADERIALTYIMKFGTMNFAPTQIVHPPLYHYLTFIPIGAFYVFGKLLGIFTDKVDFVRFYFNNTQYFFFIGRLMSYIFYWLTAVMIYRIIRLFYARFTAHIATIAFLLVPRFISDFSTTRPDTLLMLNCSLSLYFFLKFYRDRRFMKNLFLSAFFLGLASATKYNALFLGFIFIAFFAYEAGVSLRQKSDLKNLLAPFFGVGVIAFLGFFIGDPFFVLRYKTYLYNLYVFDTVWVNQLYGNYSPSLFLITRIRDISSTLYLNLFGVLILLLGCWNLLKKEKKLLEYFLIIFFVFEIYFSLLHKNCSPTYYFNPLLPIAALIFSSGVDFMLRFGKRAISILIVFFMVLSFNYFVQLRDLSARPTYLQEARAFIEKSIPGYSNICIASDNNLPQLNMTRASYGHLIETDPGRNLGKDAGISYKPMDSDEYYTGIYRELRIQSLMKKPQYNLIRWDKLIKNEEEAAKFFHKQKIEYVICNGPVRVGGKELKDTDIVSLIREFKPNNTRVYEDNNFYIYKVKNHG